MVNKLGMFSALAVALMFVAAIGTAAATSNSDGSATTSTTRTCDHWGFAAFILRNCTTTVEINSTSTVTSTATVNSTVTAVVTVNAFPPFYNVTVGSQFIPCQTQAQYNAYALLDAATENVSAQGTWTGCHGVVGDAVLPSK